MLLMFQRAETTERKAKDNRQEKVRESDKKNPPLINLWGVKRDGFIYGVSLNLQVYILQI